MRLLAVAGLPPTDDGICPPPTPKIGGGRGAHQGARRRKPLEDSDVHSLSISTLRQTVGVHDITARLAFLMALPVVTRLSAAPVLALLVVATQGVVGPPRAGSCPVLNAQRIEPTEEEYVCWQQTSEIRSDQAVERERGVVAPGQKIR